MKVWRIIAAAHRDTPWAPPRLDHRWTSARSLVTYAALEPGTALAEALTYVRDVGQLAGRLLVGGAYEGSQRRLDPLPDGWDAWPHDPRVQAAGDAWCEAGETGALIVPSVILPADNIILNQDHPEFAVRTTDVVSLRKLDRP